MTDYRTNAALSPLEVAVRAGPQPALGEHHPGRPFKRPRGAGPFFETTGGQLRVMKWSSHLGALLLNPHNFGWLKVQWL
jgi:hypothetical protein